MIPESVFRGPPVQLDWQAYFNEFSNLHGGDPVPWNERLLFRDGWSYSNKDYEGPEWPPEGDLFELREYYWRQRRRIVLEELLELRATLEHLKVLQQGKDAKLQQVRRVWDEEAKSFTFRRGPLNTEAMRSRVEWLESDLKVSEREIDDVRKERSVALQRIAGPDRPEPASAVGD